MVDLKNNILSNTIMAVKILMLKPSSRMDGMEEDVLDIEAQENLITFYEIPMGSRVDLVAYKLKGGAQSSWKNLQLIRERQGKLPITSCERMERELRRRFLPPNHDQILFNLLQNYVQGFVNMDDAWDLQAVVRSCTTGTAADVTAAVNATTVEDYDDGSYNLEVLASGNEDNTFLYQSTFGKSFSGGLEDVYKAGCGGTLPTAMATTSSMANVAIGLDGEGFVFVHEHQLPMLTDSHSFSLHAMESQSARPRKRIQQRIQDMFNFLLREKAWTLFISLPALKNISQEHTTACLRASALMAVLSYLDFYRVALSTATNMCKNLPSDAADFVMVVVPLLTSLLQYHDAKVNTTKYQIYSKNSLKAESMIRG
ncbi:hypothetical protein Tco_0908881 [Tanacetum coccineum]|uniref:Uncharacterized protein n=1 Tax=Tanacetum coccineum TaxID=301880 RepID=A0ABQ5CRU8_9ASTR